MTLPTSSTREEGLRSIQALGSWVSSMFMSAFSELHSRTQPHADCLIRGYLKPGDAGVGLGVSIMSVFFILMSSQEPYVIGVVLTIFVISWGAAVNLDSLCMLIIECYCSSVSQELTLRQITRTVTTEHWNRHYSMRPASYGPISALTSL